MSKVDKFAGLLLKASGASEDTLVFFAHQTIRGADRELHKMHLVNPWIRSKALNAFMKVEGDLFEFHEVWFDDRETCQIAVDKVNCKFEKLALAAKAEVHRSWIYDHTSDNSNPWIIWVRFWGRDVNESQVKRTVEKIVK